MKNLLNTTGRIARIHSKPLVLKEPFIDFASRFADLAGTVLLMSGGDLDCARYHILGVKPWLTLSARYQKIEITVGKKNFSFQANPFDFLQQLLRAYKNGDGVAIRKQNRWPISAGLLGYLSYDLKDSIEDLPRTSIDDHGLPHMHLSAPAFIVMHDKKRLSTRVHMIERTVQSADSLDRLRDEFEKAAVAELISAPPFSESAVELTSSFTRKQYLQSVNKVREYIAAGDVYQVNLSQRFETDFRGNAFALFKELYNQNPAPFFAYIHAGSHQIVSTSPERFLHQKGRKVETRPIKGTRPRGKATEEDERFRRELKKSEKDDAELSMIVDLLRNDLGKVCTAGSVRVIQHKRLEAYTNVYHLVSVVTGWLKENSDAVDLIKAAFPGGSITGCPKIRSMEIIDELEPLRRHIYTGAIGYIGLNDTLDLSIAIRTATICDQKLVFSVGGGIVYDSNPEDEFNETLHKGRTLLTVLEGNHPPQSKRKTWAWANGLIQPLDQIRVPVTDPGFQFGYGIFETIRVEKGKPLRLKNHINRLNRSWRYLFSTPVPDLSWEVIMSQVIRKNRLTEKTAAAKIIVAMGDETSGKSAQTLVVMARPYTHRLKARQQPGLKLAVYPEPRHSPLADHKTMNYLYYFLAGKWAKARGADEALIVNADYSVSETNTANILLIKGGQVIRPDSRHVLPGVMEGAVCERLSGWGYTIKTDKIDIADLLTAENVILTNALMGAVPVIGIDENDLAASDGLCERINRELF
jgi:para-aminobenzoate synthetase component 1